MAKRAGRQAQAMVEMLVIAMAIIGVILSLSALIHGGANELMVDTAAWVNEALVNTANVTADPLFNDLF